MLTHRIRAVRLVINTESRFFRKRSVNVVAGRFRKQAPHVATRRRPSAHAGHAPCESWRCWPRHENPARLPTDSPAPFDFPPLACSSTTTEQQLRHCRPCVAVVVRAHHRKNASASSFVASPWSSLPSPPHRRSNRVLVRTYTSFSSTATVAVLTGDGAPHGQLSSHPCHPSSVSR